MSKPVEPPLKLIYANPDELRANPQAWKAHSEDQADTLNALIDQVGWADALLLNDRRAGEGWTKAEAIPTLLDGHLLKTIGGARQEKVPVLVGHWTPEQERMILLTLDPVQGMADANRQLLIALIGDLQAQNAAVLTVLESQFQDLIEQLQAAQLAEAPEPREDEAKALQKKWRTASGQLWLIPSLTVSGQFHRLLCGDSTNLDDVRRVMNGERSRLFDTDPPYLVDYDGTNYIGKLGARPQSKKWAETYHDWDNSKQGDGLYRGFMRAAVAEAITPDAAWYCWHAGKRQAMVAKAWEEFKVFIHQQIIWVKSRTILTRSWYMWQHEPCLFGWVKGKKPKRFSDEHPSSVWEFEPGTPGAQEKSLHPTSKPPGVFAIPLRQHTRPGELCYEPFSGSGSQQVAAEILGRRCYGLEREPVYVAVILQRLADMGLTPQLESESPKRVKSARPPARSKKHGRKNSI